MGKNSLLIKNDSNGLGGKKIALIKGYKTKFSIKMKTHFEKAGMYRLK